MRRCCAYIYPGVVTAHAQKSKNDQIAPKRKAFIVKLQ